MRQPALLFLAFVLLLFLLPALAGSRDAAPAAAAVTAGCCADRALPADGQPDLQDLRLYRDVGAEQRIAGQQAL